MATCSHHSSLELITVVVSLIVVVASDPACVSPLVGPFHSAAQCHGTTRCGSCEITCATGHIGEPSLLRCIGADDPMRNQSFDLNTTCDSEGNDEVSLAHATRCGLGACCPPSPLRPCSSDTMDDIYASSGQCSFMLSIGYSCETDFCPSCGMLANLCDLTCRYNSCDYKGDCWRGSRDGSTGPLQCDDGNTKDGDGCSSSGVVEPGFTCAKVGDAKPDLCLGCVDEPGWVDEQGFGCQDYASLDVCDMTSLPSDPAVPGGRFVNTPTFFKYHLMYDIDTSINPLILNVGVKAGHDIHLFLGRPYEIGFEAVIGGWENSMSVLRGYTGPVNPQELTRSYGSRANETEMRHFWLYYDNAGKLWIGEGTIESSVVSDAAAFSEKILATAFLGGNAATGGIQPSVAQQTNWGVGAMEHLHITTGYGASGEWDVRLVTGSEVPTFSQLASNGISPTHACCACGGGHRGTQCEIEDSGVLGTMLRFDASTTPAPARLLQTVASAQISLYLFGQATADGFKVQLNYVCSSPPCINELIVVPQRTAAKIAGIVKGKVAAKLHSAWPGIKVVSCRLKGVLGITSVGVVDYRWTATACGLQEGQGYTIFAVYSNGANTVGDEQMASLDFTVPTSPVAKPQSIHFVDGDPAPMEISGVAQLEGAVNDENILQYRIYFGKNTTAKVDAPDERTAFAGHVNTFGTGGLRNDFNNGCLYNDCAWKMEPVWTHRRRTQYRLRHSHTGECFCQSDPAKVLQAEPCPSALTDLFIPVKDHLVHTVLKEDGRCIWGHESTIVNASVESRLKNSRFSECLCQVPAARPTTSDHALLPMPAGEASVNLLVGKWCYTYLFGYRVGGKEASTRGYCEWTLRAVSPSDDATRFVMVDADKEYTHATTAPKFGAANLVVADGLAAYRMSGFAGLNPVPTHSDGKYHASGKSFDTNPFKIGKDHAFAAWVRFRRVPSEPFTIGRRSIFAARIPGGAQESCMLVEQRSPTDDRSAECPQPVCNISVVDQCCASSGNSTSTTTTRTTSTTTTRTTSSTVETNWTSNTSATTTAMLQHHYIEEDYVCNCRCPGPEDYVNVTDGLGGRYVLGLEACSSEAIWDSGFHVDVPSEGTGWMLLIASGKGDSDGMGETVFYASTPMEPFSMRFEGKFGCRSPGCTATGIIYDVPRDGSRTCYLDVGVYMTDFANSGEEVTQIIVEGAYPRVVKVARESCRPDGSNAHNTLYLCVIKYNVDDLVNGAHASRSLKVHVTISPNVNQFPKDGNYLSGVAEVVCKRTEAIDKYAPPSGSIRRVGIAGRTCAGAVLEAIGGDGRQDETGIEVDVSQAWAFDRYFAKEDVIGLFHETRTRYFQDYEVPLGGGRASVTSNLHEAKATANIKCYQPGCAASHTLTGLPTSHAATCLLTVLVQVTDFSNDDEFVEYIRLDGTDVVLNCQIGADADGVVPQNIRYACADQLDVSQAVLKSTYLNDGKVEVAMKITDAVNMWPNAYGHYLDANVELHCSGPGSGTAGSFNGDPMTLPEDQRADFRGLAIHTLPATTHLLATSANLEGESGYFADVLKDRVNGFVRAPILSRAVTGSLWLSNQESPQSAPIDFEAIDAAGSLYIYAVERAHAFVVTADDIVNHTRISQYDICSTSSRRRGFVAISEYFKADPELSGCVFQPSVPYTILTYVDREELPHGGGTIGRVNIVGPAPLPPFDFGQKPKQKARKVEFVDVDYRAIWLNGVVTITGAYSEEDIDFYEIWLGDGPYPVKDASGGPASDALIAKVPADGRAQYTFDLEDIGSKRLQPCPLCASHLLIITSNSHGLCEVNTRLVLKDASMKFEQAQQHVGLAVPVGNENSLMKKYYALITLSGRDNFVDIAMVRKGAEVYARAKDDQTGLDFTAFTHDGVDDLICSRERQQSDDSVFWAQWGSWRCDDLILPGVEYAVVFFANIRTECPCKLPCACEGALSTTIQPLLTNSPAGNPSQLVHSGNYFQILDNIAPSLISFTCDGRCTTDDSLTVTLNVQDEGSSYPVMASCMACVDKVEDPRTNVDENLSPAFCVRPGDADKHRYWRISFKNSNLLNCGSKLALAELELFKISVLDATGELAKGTPIHYVQQPAPRPGAYECDVSGVFAPYRCDNQDKAKIRCESQRLQLCSKEQLASQVGKTCRYMWTTSSPTFGYYVSGGGSGCGTDGEMMSTTASSVGIGFFDAACCEDETLDLLFDQLTDATTTTGTTYKMIIDSEEPWVGLKFDEPESIIRARLWFTNNLCAVNTLTAYLDYSDDGLTWTNRLITNFVAKLNTGMHIYAGTDSDVLQDLMKGTFYQTIIPGEGVRTSTVHGLTPNYTYGSTCTLTDFLSNTVTKVNHLEATTIDDMGPHLWFEGFANASDFSAFARVKMRDPGLSYPAFTRCIAREYQPGTPLPSLSSVRGKDGLCKEFYALAAPDSSGRIPYKLFMETWLTEEALPIVIEQRSWGGERKEMMSCGLRQQAMNGKGSCGTLVGRRKQAMQFSLVVNGFSDAYIYLGKNQRTDIGYEILIGGAGNSMSQIRRGYSSDPVNMNLNYPSTVASWGGPIFYGDIKWSHLWVVVDPSTGRVAVGRGEIFNYDTLMEYIDPYPIDDIDQIWLGAGHHSGGGNGQFGVNFVLCPKIGNVLLNQKATSSSVAFKATPDKVVDGIYSLGSNEFMPYYKQADPHLVCAQTRRGTEFAPPWIKVFMGRDVRVMYVRIVGAQEHEVEPAQALMSVFVGNNADRGDRVCVPERHIYGDNVIACELTAGVPGGRHLSIYGSGPALASLPENMGIRVCEIEAYEYSVHYPFNDEKLPAYNRYQRMPDLPAVLDIGVYQEFEMTGLQPNTTYEAFCYGEDSLGNYSLSGAAYVTTTDNVPPLVSIVNVKAHDYKIEVNLSLDDPGDSYPAFARCAATVNGTTPQEHERYFQHRFWRMKFTAPDVLDIERDRDCENQIHIRAASLHDIQGTRLSGFEYASSGPLEYGRGLAPTTFKYYELLTPTPPDEIVTEIIEMDEGDMGELAWSVPRGDAWIAWDTYYVSEFDQKIVGQGGTSFGDVLISFEWNDTVNFYLNTEFSKSGVTWSENEILNRDHGSTSSGYMDVRCEDWSQCGVESPGQRSHLESGTFALAETGDYKVYITRGLYGSFDASIQPDEPATVRVRICDQVFEALVDVNISWDNGTVVEAFAFHFDKPGCSRSSRSEGLKSWQSSTVPGPPHPPEVPLWHPPPRGKVAIDAWDHNFSTCSETQNLQEQAWWRSDLGRTARVEAIWLAGSVSSNPHLARFVDVYVVDGDATMATHGQLCALKVPIGEYMDSTNPIRAVNCARDSYGLVPVGDHIWVINHGTEQAPIGLCEVEVFMKPISVAAQGFIQWGRAPNASRDEICGAKHVTVEWSDDNATWTSNFDFPTISTNVPVDSSFEALVASIDGARMQNGSWPWWNRLFLLDFTATFSEKGVQPVDIPKLRPNTTYDIFCWAIDNNGNDISKELVLLFRPWGLLLEEVTTEVAHHGARRLLMLPADNGRLQCTMEVQEIIPCEERIITTDKLAPIVRFSRLVRAERTSIGEGVGKGYQAFWEIFLHDPSCEHRLSHNAVTCRVRCQVYEPSKVPDIDEWYIDTDSGCSRPACIEDTWSNEDRVSLQFQFLVGGSTYKLLCAAVDPWGNAHRLEDEFYVPIIANTAPPAVPPPATPPPTPPPQAPPPSGPVSPTPAPTPPPPQVDRDWVTMGPSPPSSPAYGGYTGDGSHRRRGNTPMPHSLYGTPTTTPVRPIPAPPPASPMPVPAPPPTTMQPYQPEVQRSAPQIYAIVALRVASKEEAQMMIQPAAIEAFRRTLSQVLQLRGDDTLTLQAARYLEALGGGRRLAGNWEVRFTLVLRLTGHVHSLDIQSRIAALRAGLPLASEFARVYKSEMAQRQMPVDVTVAGSSLLDESQLAIEVKAAAASVGAYWESPEGPNQLEGQGHKRSQTESSSDSDIMTWLIPIIIAAAVLLLCVPAVIICALWMGKKRVTNLEKAALARAVRKAEQEEQVKNNHHKKLHVRQDSNRLRPSPSPGALSRTSSKISARSEPPRSARSIPRSSHTAGSRNTLPEVQRESSQPGLCKIAWAHPDDDKRLSEERTCTPNSANSDGKRAGTPISEDSTNTGQSSLGSLNGFIRSSQATVAANRLSIAKAQPQQRPSALVSAAPPLATSNPPGHQSIGGSSGSSTPAPTDSDDALRRSATVSPRPENVALKMRAAEIFAVARQPARSRYDDDDEAVEVESLTSSSSARQAAVAAPVTSSPLRLAALRQAHQPTPPCPPESDRGKESATPKDEHPGRPDPKSTSGHPGDGSRSSPHELLS